MISRVRRVTFWPPSTCVLIAITTLEQYKSLIEYVKMNKEAGSDWFKLEANKTGTRWTGKCWVMHNFKRYEFELEVCLASCTFCVVVVIAFGNCLLEQFELPVSYPVSPVPLALPELDGKTEKMYRGGLICLDAHFQPLWSKNVPHFGIAHALAMGLAPWLASEVPHLVETGVLSK